MKIKRILTAAATVLICAMLGIAAFAIEIDGICGNYEWQDSSVFVLKEQKSFNNKIKSSVVRAKYEEKEGFVYFAILTEYEKDGSLEDGEIKLRVNGEPILINLCDGVVDDGGFEVYAESMYDEMSYCTVTEAAVYMIDGVTLYDEFKINLFDLNGKESGTFELAFEAESQETESTDENQSETEKEDKTSKTKTTKSKTAKKSSSKKSSYKKSATTKAFNFKKVDKNKKSYEKADGEEYEEYEAEDDYSSAGEAEIIVNPSSSSHNEKYIYVAVGTFCALGIAVAAVVCAMKSNEAKDKKEK